MADKNAPPAGASAEKPGRTRVVIIGGGCGGVATAFWLTATAALRARFEVTLYTHGWRLGGKGASGRNAGDHDRIEEHGLHLWLGWYRRAFQMMRLCYAEDPGPGSFENVAAAFLPVNDLTLEERLPGDAWSPWRFHFPAVNGTPDDPDRASLGDLIVAFAKWVRRLIDTHLAGEPATTGYKRALEALVESAKPGLDGDPKRAARLLNELNGQITTALSAKALAPGAGHAARRALLLANLGVAIGAGVALDILLRPDLSRRAAFERLNQRDFRDWLGAHLASREALASPPLRAIYDLAFAYPGGDTSAAGSIAAGTVLGLVLDMAGYRGAPFWKMASGMGDTVFAPLYRVLEARGVRINLFHRLLDVQPDGEDIGSLLIRRQADTNAGPYAPFVEVKGRRCWPNAPDWGQLKDGDTLERTAHFEFSGDDTEAGRFTLRRGCDFDRVVLAVPPETLKRTTGRLTAKRWREMLDNSASVATVALQLWLTVPEVGDWAPGALLGAYEQPLSTWADMSHLLKEESWSGPRAARSVHYFCGATTFSGAGAAVDRWMAGPLTKLWPIAAGGLPSALVAGEWCPVNADLSEQYVQVPPGSVAHRLEPDSKVYGNLWLAGDWTWARNSGGCVENAVGSGLAVARSISGDDTLGHT